MSNLMIFAIGLVIAIPAGITVVGLLIAASTDDPGWAQAMLAEDALVRRVSLLGWLVMAVLLVDAGFDLRAGEYWAAIRGLAIVLILPVVLAARRGKSGAAPSA